MITKIEDYFEKGCGRCARFETPQCSARLWAEGLASLREICLGAGLEETVKWGQPCYRHEGRNIAIIGALQKDFRLSFFNAALMQDAEGILELAGPNTAHASVIRFDSDDAPGRMTDVLASYLKEAMGYAKAGIKPERKVAEIDLPEELIAALDDDPELAEAFHGLTPGRQRSYAINLNSAKKSETRIARIAKFRAKIIAGKGALER